jgi:hypothetical protein
MMKQHPFPATDFPFAAVVRKATTIIEMGHEVHQKFTCDGCGTRLTIAEPNIFHEFGTCDKCPVTTDIKRNGCNYMVVLSRRGRRTG